MQDQNDNEVQDSIAAGPLIMVWTEDFFLVPRFEDAARAVGARIEIVQKADVLSGSGAPIDRPIPLTEPLDGPDASLVEIISEKRPGLVLVDTTAQELPWARWIQILKTSAATRRIPIVAFGPHVEKENLDLARKAGADQVLTRGQLQAKLGQVLQDWMRILPQDALDIACQGELSTNAIKGITLLNQGEYHQAHEYLEHAWQEAPEIEGYLYRALLQISVAYLHIERRNPAGVIKMLLRLHQWLDPLADQCRGVDLAWLKSHALVLREAFRGPRDQIPRIDPEDLLLPIRLLTRNSD